tara:strand:- start:6428 stop:7174 length:747 start_codon:yes stop_codon:yes gene_type:complete
MKRYYIPLIVLVAIFIIWEITVSSFSIPSYLLPSPISILTYIWESAGLLLSHASITFSEALAGFLLAAVIGIFFSALFDLSDLARLGLYPYVILIRIAPVIAIAPFLILWFGNGILSKILTATIMSVFFVVVNLTKGFNEVGKEYSSLMKSTSASKWQILTKLKFPNAIPYLFSGLKMAVATSVAGAVVAEFVGSNAGLGYLILTNFYYLKTTEMFASLFTLFLGGILFFAVVSLIEARFFSKYSVKQ